MGRLGDQGLGAGPPAAWGGGRPGPRAELRRALLAGRGLLAVATAEEERVRAWLEVLSGELLEGGVVGWSCLDGLAGRGGETVELLGALAALRADERFRGLAVLSDPGPFLACPRVQRALRELQRAWAGSGRAAVLVGVDLEVPAGLRHDVPLVEVGPPDEEELARLAGEVWRRHAGEAGRERLPEVVRNLRGLSLTEARFALAGALREAGPTGDLLGPLFREKARLAAATGVLEPVAVRPELACVGGLERLKAWLAERRGLLDAGALERGLPVPRGLLLMGVSGCGKSLAVKAAAATWGVPLFRLDLNRVFSGLHGSPEAAFDRALRALDAIAPVVLWIDELENALEASAGGAGSGHLFATFLTWMQEKPPLVFVAATANRIELLPAEVLRKGRFDEVFFCDLPTAAERREVLAVQLARHGADPETFALDDLVADTHAWTGAELELAVASARTRALADGRAFTTADVTRVADATVPLARTMQEQIRALREWAAGRAASASRDRHPRAGLGGASDRAALVERSSA